MGRGKAKNGNKGGGSRNHQNSSSLPYETTELFQSYNSQQQASSRGPAQADGRAATPASSQHGNKLGSGTYENGPIRVNGHKPNEYQRNLDSGHKPNEYQRNLDSGHKPNEYQRNLDEEHQKSSLRSNRSNDHRDDGQYKNNSHHHKNNSGQQSWSGKEDQRLSGKSGGGSGVSDKPSLLKCVECSELYNLSSKLPRALSCGHTLCTVCLRAKIAKNPKCPFCQIQIKEKDAENTMLNFIVRDLVQHKLDAERSEHRASGIQSTQPKSGPSKTVVTVGSNRSPEINSSYVEYREQTEGGSKSPEKEASYAKRDSKERAAASPERSPHNSMCLETGIAPTSHCAMCRKWVCDKCGKIDHPQHKGCFLIHKEEALKQMKDARVSGAKATGETVENTLKEMEIYDEQLGAYSMTMQAAFESIGKEKERVKTIMKEGQKRKRELDALVSTFPESKNLPDVLASLQQVEDLCQGTQQWTTSYASNTLDNKKLVEVTKEILLSTVQMKMLAESENQVPVLVLAFHTLSDVPLYSRLTLEGGRILVHSLEKMGTVPKGSRAMPLMSVKSCLDPASALTFLEIGWGGSSKGFVYIRMMGDTLWGRQFVMLCTGEAGPSYRQTKFHRVWWQGLPGEHIWGGDYDKGDGSGGSPVLKISDAERSSLVTSRTLPVRAGLVAGRYEKTNVSSIFRIYTKESKDVKDESAFGQVEYGLQILDSAIKHKNVNDVIIYNCGIVIET